MCVCFFNPSGVSTDDVDDHVSTIRGHSANTSTFFLSLWWFCTGKFLFPMAIFRGCGVNETAAVTWSTTTKQYPRRERKWHMCVNTVRAIDRAPLPSFLPFNWSPKQQLQLLSTTFFFLLLLSPFFKIEKAFARISFRPTPHVFTDSQNGNK